MLHRLLLVTNKKSLIGLMKHMQQRWARNCSRLLQMGLFPLAHPPCGHSAAGHRSAAAPRSALRFRLRAGPPCTLTRPCNLAFTLLLGATLPNCAAQSDPLQSQLRFVSAPLHFVVLRNSAPLRSAMRCSTFPLGIA